MTKPRSVSEIKSALLRPALTSHFQVTVPFPPEIKDVLGTGQDGLNLACSDASLPGSQLATLENNNDRTGVTEKHAYRRQFDDRIDLTFYVDAKEYTSIRFFEAWISYIMNEDLQSNPFAGGGGPTPAQTPSLASRAYHYRVKYPNDYIADQGLSITKFERDYQQQLTYEFIRSFPLSISSMPVSFDASSLLKLTVSMSYIRYIVISPPRATIPGLPGSPTFSNQSSVNATLPFGSFGLNQSGINANLSDPALQSAFNTSQFTKLNTYNLPAGSNDLTGINLGIA